MTDVQILSVLEEMTHLSNELRDEVGNYNSDKGWSNQAQQFSAILHKIDNELQHATAVYETIIKIKANKS